MTAPSSTAALYLAMAALATYRLSRMIALEAGPFDMFTRLHTAAMEWAPTNVVDGLSCPLCAGAWIAAPAAYLWAYAVGAGPLAALAAWPAIAGAGAWLYMREGER